MLLGDHWTVKMMIELITVSDCLAFEIENLLEKVLFVGGEIISKTIDDMEEESFFFFLLRRICEVILA